MMNRGACSATCENLSAPRKFQVTGSLRSAAVNPVMMPDSEPQAIVKVSGVS
jgi:hypothetical protein